MFTGIVENQATVIAIHQNGSNVDFVFESALAPELKIDQSLSHNGVCLTVTNINENTYTVTAIQETLNRTNLGNLIVGQLVNLERCLPANGRLDGHIVQGHVDCAGSIDEIHDLDGSWMIFISHPVEAGLTVTKGSVCLNGVSITVVDSFPDAFSVAIIPYTWEHTNLSQLTLGDSVNIEFDILGKYMKKLSVSLPLIK
ncbi:MAG: riboflavin synthase [Bacteroidetes bacterium]|nr:riboflavin synthase [Bacteroidota bacterium]MDA1224945.1 riboflavin synthase [Bacteroidota bacterium]